MADEAGLPPASGTRVPEVTIAEFVDSEARRTTLVVFGVLLILAVAFATYYGVKHSLRHMRGVNLQARLDAELRAFEVWVAQRSNVVERWAEDPRTGELVRSLAARHAAAAPSEACASREGRELIALLRPALQVRRFGSFDLVDRSGLVLMSHDPARCGKRVSTRRFLAALDRTFAGRTSFVRPYRESERLAESPAGGDDQIYVWFGAPVRDSQGAAVAALGFAEPARAEFASLLRGARAGETDEVYLFDDQGWMLSESRYSERLVASGLLAAGAGADTMLNVQVRDPGAEAAGAVSRLERSAQPLTRLAALAIASRESAQPGQHRGVLLEPYRNYAGAEVVGAWRWLPEHAIGAALEIGADEAYAPVKFLDRAFSIVLGLAAATMVGVVIALRTNVLLRRGLGSFRRMGRYRLLREIAQGGMASIHLGRHALLKRPIAIKILKRALANDEMIARFEREVQAASQLHHPNTVQVFDYGRTRGGDFYYVMEFVDGITLAALVERDGALPAARAIHFLRQMCGALREAHARGVLHRDIKPENVMACERAGEYDVIKILDFGLVKVMRDEVSRDVTGSIRVLGTPAYMAPERFSGQAPVDERADVYALGAVAYLLLTGRRIFHDAAGEELQLRILHAPVAAPSQVLGRELPPELDALVQRCLAKRPEERPASVDELLAALEALAQQHRWTRDDARRWWSEYRRSNPPLTQELK